MGMGMANWIAVTSIVVTAALAWETARLLRDKKETNKKLSEILPDANNVDLTVLSEADYASSKLKVWAIFEGILLRMKNIFSDILEKQKGFALDIYAIDRNLKRFSEVFGTMRRSVDSGQDALEAVKRASDEQNGTVGKVSDISRTLYALVEELTAVTNEVSEKAQSGVNDMRAMKGTISGVKQEIETMVGVSENLSEKAETVRSVVESITGIAEQTNLLALNASIEAARAGVAGRGFSVVAEEVRNLAEESKRAVSMISSTLDELLKNVGSATQNTRTVSSKVETSVQEINQVIESIADILQIIETVGASTSEVSQTAEKLAGISAQLDENSKNLMNRSDEAMRQFDIIEGEIAPLVEQTVSMSSKTAGSASLTEALIRSLAAIRMNDDAVFVNIAKNAEKSHITFVENLKKGIESNAYFDLEGNPNRCALGIFFNLIPKPVCIEQDLWNDTITLHETFHPLYHKALTATLGHDKAQAMRCYSEAEKLSKKIISNLHTMMNVCASR